MGVKISGPGPAACAVLVVVVDGEELFLHAMLGLTKSELIHSAPEEDISVTVVVTVTVAPFQKAGLVISGAGESMPQLLIVVVMTEGIGKGGSPPDGRGKGGAPPEGMGKDGAPPEGSGKGGNPSPEDMGKGKGN